MSRFWIAIVLLLAGAGPIGTAIAGAAPSAAGHDITGPADLVIRNGRVLDGTGAPTIAADILIDDGRIGFVGEVDRSVRALRTIDAAGRIVAPGFIDLHGRGDPATTPAIEQYLAMGVTTIVLGHDGAGPVVEDLGVWLDEVAARGIGLNLAMLVGLGALREQTGIGAQALPGIAGFDALRSRLDGALDRAFGLSLGLDAEPGRHAGELELRALARIVGARDRLLAGRLRQSDDPAIERALDEFLRLGNHARIHIAQFSSVGGVGQARAGALLFELDLARRQGMRVTADVVPSGAWVDGPPRAVDPALQDRLLQDPHVAIGSEGGISTTTPASKPASLPGTTTGPLTAFAWVIESHVRARGLLTLPEAVRRMTALPAEIVGLADRGRIAPGFAADVVIFDPNRVRARASAASPLALAEGFDVVLVNGRVARQDGSVDPGRFGSVLRP